MRLVDNLSDLRDTLFLKRCITWTWLRSLGKSCSVKFCLNKKQRGSAMSSPASFKTKTGLCDEPNGPSLIPEIFLERTKEYHHLFSFEGQDVGRI